MAVARNTIYMFKLRKQQWRLLKSIMASSILLTREDSNGVADDESIQACVCVAEGMWLLCLWEWKCCARELQWQCACRSKQWQWHDHIYYVRQWREETWLAPSLPFSWLRGTIIMPLCWEETSREREANGRNERKEGRKTDPMSNLYSEPAVSENMTWQWKPGKYDPANKQKEEGVLRRWRRPCQKLENGVLKAGSDDCLYSTIHYYAYALTLNSIPLCPPCGDPDWGGGSDWSSEAGLCVRLGGMTVSDGREEEEEQWAWGWRGSPTPCPVSIFLEKAGWWRRNVVWWRGPRQGNVGRRRRRQLFMPLEREIS